MLIYMWLPIQVNEIFIANERLKNVVNGKRKNCKRIGITAFS
jgi:hypothetical protein